MNFNLTEITSTKFLIVLYLITFLLLSCEKPISSEPNDPESSNILFQNETFGTLDLDIDMDGNTDLIIENRYTVFQNEGAHSWYFDLLNPDIKMLSVSEESYTYISTDTIQTIDTIQPYLRNDIYIVRSCEMINSDNLQIDTSSYGEILWTKNVATNNEIPNGIWSRKLKDMRFFGLPTSVPPNDSEAYLHDEFTISHFEHIVDCNSLQNEEIGFFFFRMNDIHYRAEIQKNESSQHELIEFISLP